MAYKITFRNKTTKIVTDNRGKQLGQLLMDGKVKVVEIDEAIYRISEINSVAPCYEASSRTILEDHQLESTTCKGMYSIQAEINSIAKSEYPDRWAEVIRNGIWREKTRSELLSQSDHWCDSKMNVCNCD